MTIQLNKSSKMFKILTEFINKKTFQFFFIGFFITLLMGTVSLYNSEIMVIENEYTNMFLPTEPVDIDDENASESLDKNQMRFFLKSDDTDNPSTAKKIKINFDEWKTETKEVSMKVRKGDTLSLILQRAGIGFTESKNISVSLSSVLDIRTLKPFSKNQNGDVIILEIAEIPEENRLDKTIAWTVRNMEIIRSPIEKIITERNDLGFVSSLLKIEPQIKLVRKSGQIKEGQSFIYSATKEGISYDVIDKFYEVLSFDVDFERDIYPNDSYEVLYEEKYTPDGKFIEVGSLLYAGMDLHGTKMSLYRYTNENGRVAFYDEKGKGASKTLKKTPINGARVSSKFGYRQHPILGFNALHRGIDFAAPHGTPIPAGGDGVIESRGWNNGGYGYMIKIRHNATYSTLYAHMSGFKSGQGTGSRIRQGEIIGFVGSTGMSTGPHLHYEILKNGRSINPSTVLLPSTDILKGEVLEKFSSEITKIKTAFTSLKSNTKTALNTKKNKSTVVSNNIKKTLTSRPAENDSTLGRGGL